MGRWNFCCGWRLVPVLAIFVACAVSKQVLPPTRNASQQYTVVIDAGSTGSRAHVYSYSWSAHDASSVYPKIHLPPVTFKVSPGLASLHTNISAVNSYLQPLLQFAEKEVPASQRSTCEIHLLATAGVRLLPQESQDKLIQAVRQVLADSHFRFKPHWARVLTGSLEGVYAWVAVNYASGALQYAESMSSKVSTAATAAVPLSGILELGGASLQITTVVGKGFEGKEKHLVMLNLPGIKVALFSRSFNGFGVHSARAKASQMVPLRQADPCSNIGLTSPAKGKGGGDFKRCQGLAAQLLSSVHCSDAQQPCTTSQPLASGLAAASKALPAPLTGNFYAMETFYFSVVECLGLPKDTTVEKIKATGQKYCGLNWEKAQKSAVGHPTWDGKPVPVDSLQTCCFASAYIWTLLKEVLKTDDSHGAQLLFSNSVKDANGSDKMVSWALGAMLMEVVLQSTNLPGPPHPVSPDITKGSDPDDHPSGFDSKGYGVQPFDERFIKQLAPAVVGGAGIDEAVPLHASGASKSAGFAASKGKQGTVKGVVGVDDFVSPVGAGSVIASHGVTTEAVWTAGRPAAAPGGAPPNQIVLSGASNGADLLQWGQWRTRWLAAIVVLAVGLIVMVALIKAAAGASERPAAMKRRRSGDQMLEQVLVAEPFMPRSRSRLSMGC